MQMDFHYYATYAASFLAGYSHEESMAICYSAQFVDECSKTYLKGIKAPRSAATTQLQEELADARADLLGLQDITRIWASFHFLPRDLHRNPKLRCSRAYRRKYRLICGPNGELAADTVKLAKGKSLEAAGIAMHVIADTWAHQYFAGTPSIVINNVNQYFYEIICTDGMIEEHKIRFNHNPATPDNLEKQDYTNTMFQINENSVMNLGHGRAGHFPDYSFARYRYMPAWADFNEVVKDNPVDYSLAFAQMIYALKYLKGDIEEFEVEKYDMEAMDPYRDEIMGILCKRQADACTDWKAFGEKLSGCEIEDFDVNKYKEEYLNADKDCKNNTVLGRFILAAMSQKSMVTNRIYKSGNRAAGYSIDVNEKGFRGIRDYARLLQEKEDER